MSDFNNSVRVVAADPTSGNLIVHFSDGTSVLYHAHFLHEVRHDDGNIALPNGDEMEVKLEE